MLSPSSKSRPLSECKSMMSALDTSRLETGRAIVAIFLRVSWGSWPADGHLLRLQMKDGEERSVASASQSATRVGNARSCISSSRMR